MVINQLILCENYFTKRSTLENKLVLQLLKRIDLVLSAVDSNNNIIPTARLIRVLIYTSYTYQNLYYTLYF